MFNSLKFNKILIALLTCLLLFSLVIPVFADDGYVGMAVLAKEMADTVYGSGEAFSLQGAIEVLLFVPGDTDDDKENAYDKEMKAMNSIWDYAEKAYNSLMSIGASIALLFFLLEVLDKTTREMMTLEQFIIFFIKLIVALFILNNGFKIIESFLTINKEICDYLEPTKIAGISTGGDKTTYDKICQDIKIPIAGQLFAIGAILKMLIPYLGTLLASMYITFICWGRFFEIGVRTAFAPIGMVDIITEGFKFSNLKYFKKLIAVIFQGAIILTIMRVVGMANDALLSSFLPGGYSYLIIFFTEIGLIKKANQISNDILGV